MNPQRLFAIVCISLGTLAVPVSHAWAQGGSLGAAIMTSSDLTQPQKDEIRKLVDANKEGLRGDPAAIKRSRNALLEPMKEPQISVAFRLEYTRQLSTVLRPLITDAREVVAVNALRLAGELATATSVEMLSDALKDKRAGVRYAAAAGFESTFQSLRRTVPALGGAQASRAIATLEQALLAETDPRVLEGLTLAMQEASKIPKAQVEGMRDVSTLSLARAVSAKAADRTIGAWADPAFRRAVLAVRTTVTNPNINEPELQATTLRQAAGMAGDLLALAAERMKSAGNGDADLALMVNEAETAIFFISGKLGVTNAKEYKLHELVAQGKAAEFLRQVQQLIGPNGVLTSQNFGFADDHFTKPR